MRSRGMSNMDSYCPPLYQNCAGSDFDALLTSATGGARSGSGSEYPALDTSQRVYDHSTPTYAGFDENNAVHCIPATTTDRSSSDVKSAQGNFAKLDQSTGTASTNGTTLVNFNDRLQDIRNEESGPGEDQDSMKKLMELLRAFTGGATVPFLILDTSTRDVTMPIQWFMNSPYGDPKMPIEADLFSTFDPGYLQHQFAVAKDPKASKAFGVGFDASLFAATERCGRPDIPLCPYNLGGSVAQAQQFNNTSLERRKAAFRQVQDALNPISPLAQAPPSSDFERVATLYFNGDPIPEDLNEQLSRTVYIRSSTTDADDDSTSDASPEYEQPVYNHDAPKYKVSFEDSDRAKVLKQNHVEDGALMMFLEDVTMANQLEELYRNGEKVSAGNMRVHRHSTYKATKEKAKEAEPQSSLRNEGKRLQDIDELRKIRNRAWHKVYLNLTMIVISEEDAENSSDFDNKVTDPGAKSFSRFTPVDEENSDGLTERDTDEGMSDTTQDKQSTQLTTGPVALSRKAAAKRRKHAAWKKATKAAAAGARDLDPVSEATTTLVPPPRESDTLNLPTNNKRNKSKAAGTSLRQNVAGKSKPAKHSTHDEDIKIAASRSPDVDSQAPDENGQLDPFITQVVSVNSEEAAVDGLDAQLYDALGISIAGSHPEKEWKTVGPRSTPKSNNHAIVSVSGSDGKANSVGSITAPRLAGGPVDQRRNQTQQAPGLLSNPPQNTPVFNSKNFPAMTSTTPIKAATLVESSLPVSSNLGRSTTKPSTKRLIPVVPRSFSKGFSNPVVIPPSSLEPAHSRVHGSYLPKTAPRYITLNSLGNDTTSPVPIDAASKVSYIAPFVTVKSAESPSAESSENAPETSEARLAPNNAAKAIMAKSTAAVSSNADLTSLESEAVSDATSSVLNHAVQKKPSGTSVKSESVHSVSNNVALKSVTETAEESSVLDMSTVTTTKKTKHHGKNKKKKRKTALTEERSGPSQTPAGRSEDPESLQADGPGDPSQVQAPVTSSEASSNDVVLVLESSTQVNDTNQAAVQVDTSVSSLDLSDGATFVQPPDCSVKVEDMPVNQNLLQPQANQDIVDGNLEEDDSFAMTIAPLAEVPADLAWADLTSPTKLSFGKRRLSMPGRHYDAVDESFDHYPGRRGLQKLGSIPDFTLEARFLQHFPEAPAFTNVADPFVGDITQQPTMANWSPSNVSSMEDRPMSQASVQLEATPHTDILSTPFRPASHQGKHALTFRRDIEFHPGAVSHKVMPPPHQAPSTADGNDKQGLYITSTELVIGRHIMFTCTFCEREHVPTAEAPLIFCRLCGIYPLSSKQHLYQRNGSSPETQRRPIRYCSEGCLLSDAWYHAPVCLNRAAYDSWENTDLGPKYRWEAMPLKTVGPTRVTPELFRQKMYMMYCQSGSPPDVWGAHEQWRPDLKWDDLDLPRVADTTRGVYHIFRSSATNFHPSQYISRAHVICTLHLKHDDPMKMMIVRARNMCFTTYNERVLLFLFRTLLFLISNPDTFKAFHSTEPQENAVKELNHQFFKEFNFDGYRPYEQEDWTTEEQLVAWEEAEPEIAYWESKLDVLQVWKKRALDEN